VNDGELKTQSLGKPPAGWERIPPFNPAQIGIDEEPRTGVTARIQILSKGKGDGSRILPSGDPDRNGGAGSEHLFNFGRRGDFGP
jgi:hypothetical protein